MLHDSTAYESDEDARDHLRVGQGRDGRVGAQLREGPAAVLHEVREELPELRAHDEGDTCGEENGSTEMELSLVVFDDFRPFRWCSRVLLTFGVVFDYVQCVWNPENSPATK